MSGSTRQPLRLLPMPAAETRHPELPLEVLRQILRPLHAAAGGARDKRIVGELSRWQANLSLLRAKGHTDNCAARLDTWMFDEKKRTQIFARIAMRLRRASRDGDRRR
jgi:hypothetical protein